MTIRLKGELDIDLKRLGLESGDILHRMPIPGKYGSIYFVFDGVHCVVYPENYDII